MFSRRLEDVFSATIFCLPRPLEDAFKTSCKISLRRLERRKIVTVKTCLRRLQDVLRDVLRRLEDVLKDEKLLPWRRVEEFFKTCLEDVLKTNKCLLGCHSPYSNFSNLTPFHFGSICNGKLQRCDGSIAKIGKLSKIKQKSVVFKLGKFLTITITLLSVMLYLYI